MGPRSSSKSATSEQRPSPKTYFSACQALREAAPRAAKTVLRRYAFWTDRAAHAANLQNAFLPVVLAVVLAGHEGLLVSLGLRGVSFDRSILRAAAQQGRAGCVEIMLAFGTDVAGEPVEHAAAGQHWRTVDVLLAAGANVNGCLASRPPTSALHWAAHDPVVARRLIDHGADVCALNATGDTPLMCAIRARAEITPGLEDYDLRHTNKHGSTTLELAETYGYTTEQKIESDGCRLSIKRSAR